MWTPHVIIKLQPENSPVTESAVTCSPYSIRFNACPFLPHACAYLTPSPSPPFPLWFSSSTLPGCPRIARRSPPLLPLLSVDSDDCEVLRHLLWSLIFFLSSGAHTDATKSARNAGDRVARPRPKITVAPHLSSRLPSPCLEAIEERDHAPESAAPSCILS
jgi:hypothetical protein